MYTLPILQVFSALAKPAAAQAVDLQGGIMAPGTQEAATEVDPGAQVAQDTATKIDALFGGVPRPRPNPKDVDLDVYQQYSAAGADVAAIVENEERRSQMDEAFMTAGIMTPPATGFATFEGAVARFMETDHGSTPMPTKDASEAGLAPEERTMDVGFGHKVQPSEEESGLIYDVPFKDDQGNYIELTDEQKMEILRKDLGTQVALARGGDDGWDADLAAKGSSWDELGEPYQQALTSLSFNVGGGKARESWNDVLDAAIAGDVVSFAAELRRKDSGKYTPGMDNRVMKELYYAGLIENRSDVASVLPLANADSGIPE